MAVGGGGAVGSENFGVMCGAYARRTAEARGTRNRLDSEKNRHDGETVACRLFSTRLNFAWRHFWKDAPAVSKLCLGDIQKIMTVANGLGSPPGLEQVSVAKAVTHQCEYLDGPSREATKELEERWQRTGDIFAQRLQVVESRALEAEATAQRVTAQLAPLLKKMEQAESEELNRAEDKRNVRECETQARRDYPSSCESQPRKLTAHLSDESTCAMGSVREEKEEKEEDGTISIASTEEWEPKSSRTHTRRPRKDRRKKARAKREMWEEAKSQSSRESMHDGEGSMMGAFLACIDEDGLGAESGGTSEDASDSSDNFEEKRHDFSTQAVVLSPVESDGSDNGGTSDPHNQSDDEQPHDKRARNRDELGVVPGGAVNPLLAQETLTNMESEIEDNSVDSEWSAEDRDEDLLKHKRLEDLHQGAALLPANLVWAMLHVQEMADKWYRYEEKEEDGEEEHENQLHTKPECFRGLKELRHSLKRVKKLIRELDTTWEYPPYIRRQWLELVDWILESDAGPCYQIQKIDDLVEEANDKDEEEEEEELQVGWLNEELACRCHSIRESWRDYETALEAMETAEARREYLSQQKEKEATNTQAALNARLAMSWGSRRL